LTARIIPYQPDGCSAVPRCGTLCSSPCRPGQSLVARTRYASHLACRCTTRSLPVACPRRRRAAGLPRRRRADRHSAGHAAPTPRERRPPCASAVPRRAVHGANIGRYPGERLDKLETVAEAAVAARKPAKLSWGVGTVGFGMHRRDKGGPVDHDLPVLAVRDADGKL